MADQTKEQVKKNLEKVLGGGITQAELDGWKEKYKEVSIVTVKLNANESLTGYFKKPTREILAYVTNLASDKQVFEAREFLATNTFIGGDKSILTNEDAAIAAQIKLWASFNFLQAEATKY